MNELAIVFLGISLVFAVITYRIGSQAGWHWGAALAAAFVPIVFTFFCGILGVGVGFAFVVAVWKAN